MALSEHSRETVGFLARWGLLATAIVCILLVVLGSLHATWEISRDLDTSVVFADAICESVSGVILFGQTNRPSPPRAMAVMQERQSDRPQLVGAGGTKVLLRIERPNVGLHRLLVRGMPYGAASFQSQESLLYVVPIGAETILFDSRLLQASPAEVAMLRWCVEVVQSQGSAVAFFCQDSSPQAYRRAKSSVQFFLPSAPVIGMVRLSKSPIQTFLYLSDLLVRRGSNSAMFVVTGDAELVGRLAEGNFRVYFIGPASNVKEDRRIRSFPTLNEFRRAMESR
jgi:hypothetical protein